MNGITVRLIISIIFCLGGFITMLTINAPYVAIGLLIVGVGFLGWHFQAMEERQNNLHVRA